MAVDFQYYAGLWGTLVELATGSKGTTDQLDGLLEVNWRNSFENYFFYTQYQYFTEDRQKGSNEIASTLVMGMQFLPNNHSDISVNFNRELSQFSGMNKETRIGLQIRYRF
jgi:hypothetical protein